MIHGFGLLRQGLLLGALACPAAVGLAIPTTAAAEVTSLTSCQTISSPGKYRLDADVTATFGQDCFDISANDVKLNLNGHTMTGQGGGLGIYVEVGATNADIVGPGTLLSFSEALALAGGNGSVHGVTVTENGSGISLDSAANSVRNNATTDNSSYGIFTGFLVGTTDNTIIGNYAHGNSIDDLFDDHPNCDSNVWRGNDFGTANQSCIN